MYLIVECLAELPAAYDIVSTGYPQLPLISFYLIKPRVPNGKIYRTRSQNFVLYFYPFFPPVPAPTTDSRLRFVRSFRSFRKVCTSRAKWILRFVLVTRTRIWWLLVENNGREFPFLSESAWDVWWKIRIKGRWKEKYIYWKYLKI